MYGKPITELSAKEILKRVTQWDLWSYYVPGIPFRKKFLSPFGDRTPSASLFEADDGNLILHDFRHGTFTIWRFLQTIYGMNYTEVLLMISNDFKLGLSPIKLDRPTTNAFFGITGNELPKIRETTIIKKKKRNWNDADDDYWLPYGLFKEDRLYVEPLQNFWINDNNDVLKLVYWYNEYNPSYSYEFGNGIRKIYSPLNPKKEFKFLTNANENIIQGERFLPESGDRLIITKGYKDILVLTKLGYNSVAPQSESTTLPEHKINDYKSRFKEIFILYDNDETGIKYSLKFSELYNLKQIFVPELSKCKDISDFRKLNGKTSTIGLLEELVK